MINHHNGLREFGKFRLDLDKRLLWLGGEPVALPLKAVDLLCVLVASRGAVVSKDEIWHEVWNDAFIEETNLTHNIYLLRKAFKDLGEPDLIKTVPRRGYRFTGVVHEIPDSEIVLERHSLTRTVIELQSDPAPLESEPRALLSPSRSSALLGRKGLVAGVVLAAVALVAISVWQWAKSSVGAATEIRSIAVLPLRSFNAKNEEDDDLRLRITDALITRLGSMKDIAVRPTNAVLPFVNEDRNSEEIGGKLRVDAVLDGRVQREGDRVRITLQLISVGDGKQLWSGQFDGQADRLLDLQDIVSTKVLSSLNSKVTETLAKAPTNNADAYEAYLKGRYFWSKRNEESLRKAIGYFQEAVALDPQFAEAYGGIADAQLLLYEQNIEVTPSIVSQAKETLHHALLLKPDSADALATLGSVQMSYDWDWKGAEDSLRHSTEVAPNSPNGWIRYGVLLMRLRRFAESQTALEKAVALDPLSLIGNADLGMVYFCKKDFDAADTQYRKTLAINDHFGVAHWLLSRSLWQQGRKTESVDEILIALKLDGNEELAGRLNEKVQSGTPEDCINLLLHEWRDNPAKTNPHNMAYLSTYVGDREKALSWIKRSLDEHHPWTTWISAAPEFEMLRGDSRFEEILAKVDLKDRG